MILPWPKKVKPAAPEPELAPNQRMLYASDDLLRRAENIVWVLGFQGMVGDQILAVYKLLLKYEGLTSAAQRGE